MYRPEAVSNMKYYCGPLTGLTGFRPFVSVLMFIIYESIAGCSVCDSGALYAFNLFLSII